MEGGRHPWHPRRLRGLCGERGMASLMFILTCVIILPIIIRNGMSKDRNNMDVLNTTLGQVDCGVNDTSSEHLFCGLLVPESESKHRKKRQSVNSKMRQPSDAWMEHPNPPHPYATNMWWRLTNHTVRMNAAGHCYVCAHFPHSTTGGDWWPHQNRNDTFQAAMAAVAAAGRKKGLDAIFRLSIDGILADGLKQLPQNEKTMVHDTWIPHPLPNRLFAQIATVKHVPNNLVCYERKSGNHALGMIPERKCSDIYKPVNGAVRRSCMACLRYADDLSPSVTTFTVTHAVPQPLVTYQYILTSEKGRAKCPSCSTVHVPDRKGTGVVEGYYWLCGYQVYLSLPRNWTGLCALVQLHGGVIILPHRTMDSQRRARRGLFNFLTDSPVPKNHHIWTIAEKIAVAFAPALGVESLMTGLEITRYELSSFINTTKLMMEGIKEELQGLRLTALQNRLVLDQLTASQGGVCAMIGETCCTYIPDNDADGHLIEQGIRNISMLSAMMAKEEIDSDNSIWNWLNNMFPNLHNILMLMICIVAPILILLCFWPCIMKAVKRSARSVPHHQMVVYSVSDDQLFTI